MNCDVTVTTTPRARALVEELLAAGDATDAAAKAQYLQAFPGGYAEGDEFVGVRVPLLRAMAREARAIVTLDDVDALLAQRLHQARLLGVILLGELYKSAKTPPETRDDIAMLVLRRADRLDNWDLVDAAAPFTLGPWLLTQPAARQDAVLDELAASSLIWRRRLAMVSTLGMMRGGDRRQAVRMAERLVDDSEDLMHKAVGWMLRELGIRDRARLDAFLDAHATTMPRTALRYALEKHDPARRRHYMSLARRR